MVFFCGRATWVGSVEAYIKDGETAVSANGSYQQVFENIDELNSVLQTTATLRLNVEA